jgi:hypothetical protein
LIAVGLVAVELLVVACSGDDDGATLGGGGGGGDLATVSSALAALPDDGKDHELIVWGDLSRADDIGGLERPHDPGDDKVGPYLLSLTGAVSGGSESAEPLSLLPPEAAHVERANELPAFVDDVGWNILQVDRFVERQAPPDSVTLLAGDFDAGALTHAMGKPSDDRWHAGSGKTGNVDIEKTTPARPLGETQWLTLAGGGHRLAITASPDSADAVGAAEKGDGKVVGDDPTMRALAGAVDDQKPYAAMVVPDGFAGAATAGATSPAQAQALCGDALPEPTDGVATAIADDDGPVIVIALSQASTSAAKANADALEKTVANGTSAVSNQRWSDLVTLDKVSTTGGGKVVVARLRPVEPAQAALWSRMVEARDNLVASC